MRFETDTDPAARKAVEIGLRAYNHSSSAALRGYHDRGDDKEVPFDLYAYDDAGELAGGIVAGTWGFQAKPFYEKQGYTVSGVLEDYPPGEIEYLLSKRLD